MSVSSIIDPTTGKIYDDLIGQGGGINLDKGQIITATALTEVAFPTVPPANGSVLSYDATTDTGLRYIANNPTALALNYQELFSATAGNNITPVPAPPQNNYVLTSDTDVANPTGLAWKPPTGGGGLLTANLPLFDDATTTPNTIGINFTASVGEIPYGNGTAKVGALTVAPNPASSNQFLGTVAGVPTWKNLGGQTTAIVPLVEIVGAGDESQIGIGFSNASVGQIPYGNGTVNTGALTNAPTAGQILGVNAGVPTWIDAGGSGTITGTFPIVESAGGTNESIIRIGFANKGELPCGAGGATAGAGVILPPATADNYVLSSFGSAPSGMRWVAPTAGGQTIVRSSSATTVVAPPNSTQDTLVLCAEEPDASWSLDPNPQTGKTDPYEIEFITGAYYWEAEYDPNITSLTSFIGYAVVINGVRCIKLVSKQVNTGNTIYTDVGHFYNSNYTLPATITSWIIPTAGPMFAPIGDFVFTGCFSGFHTTAGTDIPMFNICSYQSAGQSLIGTPIPLRTTTANLVGPIWSGSQATYNEGFVNKIVSLSGFLWFFGKFNRFDVNGVNTGQFLSIAKYNIATLELIDGLDLLTAGYGASMDTTGATPATINDALFTPAGKLVIVGEWNWLRSNNNQPFPAPMSGFAVGDFTLAPNPWVNTPTVVGGFNYGISLATSVALADTLIALPNTTPALPMLYTISANTLAYAGGSAPPAQLKCYLNSIVGGNTDLGFGNLPYDFILYQDVVALTTWVAFFATASGTTLQALNPSPTGVAPEYTPATLPAGVSSPYLGLSSYGLTFISFQGKDGLYSYDPTIHANLVFTGSFYYNGTLYTTATFSGTTNAHEAQSYIGTKDLKSWIQIGAKTNGLTYS
jgi:hypothetical protein